MSDLWIVLAIVAVWLVALVMLVALCASAKAGDRVRVGVSRHPRARSRRSRSGLGLEDR
jgi:hypothetical protein